MEKLTNTHTWLLWMYSFKSLEKVHSIFFEPLVIGTTLSGSPSILTVFAGLSSLIKSMSKTCCPCVPLPACHHTTWPSCPLVIQSSVALLFLIITGIPIQGESLPRKWFVAEGGRFQMIFCRAGLISLDTCFPDAFDFLPLDRFSAASGGLLSETEIKRKKRKTNI